MSFNSSHSFLWHKLRESSNPPAKGFGLVGLMAMLVGAALLALAGIKTVDAISRWKKNQTDASNSAVAVTELTRFLKDRIGAAKGYQNINF